MQEKQKGEIDFFQYLLSAPQQLNQSIQINYQMRMKFPTQINKFYPSQQSMNQILFTFQSKLQQTQQSSYTVINEILNSKILIPLLKTLQHPNLDINISSINCFYSLIVQMNEQIQQQQNNNNNNNNAYPLFFRMNSWFIQNYFIQSIFKIIDRINQNNIQQYKICKKIIQIIQFLIDFSDSVYIILIKNTKIVAFLANRVMVNFTVQHRIIDDNKYLASDLLLALLQTPQVQQGISAVRQFYQSCGIQVIIQTISSYQNKLPTQIDEREYLKNLFYCLNVMLISIKQCNKQFHQMKGCYLMISFICNKSCYAVIAIKALSNSLDSQNGNQGNGFICDQIVNNNSLQYIFPILMAQGVKGKDDEEQSEINQHILRIIYFLIRNSVGISKERVMYKFMEKRFAKIQRVFEIRVENQGNNIKSKQIDISAEEYIELIKDQGLGLVELCDKIILTIWGILPKAQAKIIALMGLYSIKLQYIKTVIQRQYKFIDEGVEKQYLAKLIAFNLRQIQENIVK